MKGQVTRSDWDKGNFVLNMNHEQSVICLLSRLMIMQCNDFGRIFTLSGLYSINYACKPYEACLIISHE